jgi:hypothetical protein
VEAVHWGAGMKEGCSVQVSGPGRLGMGSGDGRGLLDAQGFFVLYCFLTCLDLQIDPMPDDRHGCSKHSHSPLPLSLVIPTGECRVVSSGCHAMPLLAQKDYLCRDVSWLGCSHAGNS